jgi:hypothetical protein
MKKYVFIAQMLFVFNALAQNTSSEDEFKCMRELRAHMNPRHFYEPANRGTILYFLREGHDVGMFDRSHNPGMLIIEKSSIQICPMDFAHDGNARFRVSDGAGTLKMAYNPNASPNFRDLGFWSSAPSRPCENALEGPQVATTAILQKIIKQALRGYLAQKGSASPLPGFCKGAAGLAAYDIQQLRNEVAASSTPESNTPASNAEGL